MCDMGSLGGMMGGMGGGASGGGGGTGMQLLGILGDTAKSVRDGPKPTDTPMSSDMKDFSASSLSPQQIQMIMELLNKQQPPAQSFNKPGGY